MKDNRGMTLIELLVALAISAIILSALSYFAFSAIRLYHTTGVTVDLQNEAQTTLNQIVDNVMEADGIVMSYNQSEKQTECVLLGQIYVDESGVVPVYYYAGNAIVTNLADKEMYLADFPNSYSNDTVDYTEAAGTVEGGITYARMAACSVDALVEEVVAYANANNKICLMAQHIAKCYIRESDKIKTELRRPQDGRTFSNPFTLQIDLRFEQDTGNGVEVRECSNKATLRNQIDYIYINGTKYERKLKGS